MQSLYVIRMGIPEMDKLWRELQTKSKSQSLSKEDKDLYQKWGKALKLLAQNPSYPSLQSHSIRELSSRYGITVWQSYLENRRHGTPMRMFWVYGPNVMEITIIGLEPHPNPGSYKRVNLSNMP